jgi:hypothetical protein
MKPVGISSSVSRLAMLDMDGGRLTGVGVGVFVAVGGTGVFVAVGGTGVFVAVGGKGVLVAVGGMGVSVAVGARGVLVGVSSWESWRRSARMAPTVFLVSANATHKSVAMTPMISNRWEMLKPTIP